MAEMGRTPEEQGAESDQTKYIIIDPADRGYTLVTGMVEVQEHLEMYMLTDATVYEVVKEYGVKMADPVYNLEEKKRA